MMTGQWTIVPKVLVLLISDIYYDDEFDDNGVLLTSAKSHSAFIRHDS